MKHQYYDIIRRPLITEKTTLLGEYNKFTFEVMVDTNKRLVKKAIETIFEVKVKEVNMLNIKGKVKRFKGRLGKQNDFKKAIVTLEKNYTIDLSGGIK